MCVRVGCMCTYACEECDQENFSHLPVKEIKSNNFPRVLESSCSHHPQAQWTTPTNYHDIIQLDLSTVHSMHRARERLDKSCLPGRY